MKHFRSKHALTFAAVLVIVAALGLSAFAPAQDKIPVPIITATSLVTLLAGALTLVADYFPGVAAWFDALKPNSKRLVMLIGAILIVGGVFGGQCAGWLETNMVCTPNGLVDVFSNVILAFAVGQGVHLGGKPTPDFKEEFLGIDPKKASKVGV
jgi:hypothetical protein